MRNVTVGLTWVRTSKGRMKGNQSERRIFSLNAPRKLKKTRVSLTQGFSSSKGGPCMRRWLQHVRPKTQTRRQVHLRCSPMWTWLLFQGVLRPWLQRWRDWTRTVVANASGDNFSQTSCLDFGTEEVHIPACPDTLPEVAHHLMWLCNLLGHRRGSKKGCQEKDWIAPEGE